MRSIQLTICLLLAVLLPRFCQAELVWPYPAVFTAAAVGSLPIRYQWFKNATLVPGATDGTYSFPVTLGDHGSTVVCYATNSIGANTYVTYSLTATLRVFEPPTLNTTTVTVTNGAVFQLDFAWAETNQVAGLVLNGVNQTPGLYNTGNSSPYLAGAGNLLVTSPVATNPTNISYAISGDTLTLTWPGSHLGWYVQSNSVSLSNANFWFDIPGSQLATNMVIYSSPAQTNVFYRLRNP